MSFRVVKSEVAEAVYKGLGSPANFKAFVHTVLDKNWLHPAIDPTPTITRPSEFKGDQLEMKYGVIRVMNEHVEAAKRRSGRHGALPSSTHGN